MTDLSIAVSFEEVPELRLRGEIDLSTAAVVRAAVEGIFEVAVGTDAVRLDLTDVSFMDSQGLAVVARAVRLARRHGARLHVRTSPGPVRDVLRISGLSKLVASEQLSEVFGLSTHPN